MDSQPLMNERESRQRGPALFLSFTVPFFMTLLCVIAGGAPWGLGLFCGAVVGGMFLGSWLVASRASHSTGGQIIMGILFFFGGIIVVIGLFVGGCVFLMRG